MTSNSPLHSLWVDFQKWHSIALIGTFHTSYIYIYIIEHWTYIIYIYILYLFLHIEIRMCALLRLAFYVQYITIYNSALRKHPVSLMYIVIYIYIYLPGSYYILYFIIITIIIHTKFQGYISPKVTYSLYSYYIYIYIYIEQSLYTSILTIILTILYISSYIYILYDEYCIRSWSLAGWTLPSSFWTDAAHRRLSGVPGGFFSGWCPGDDLATPEAQQKVYTMCIYTIYIVYNIFIFIYYI